MLRIVIGGLTKMPITCGRLGLRRPMVERIWMLSRAQINASFETTASGWCIGLLGGI